jgi:hypothetical protein
VTFDSFCRLTNVSNAEREKLAWHLAMFRARLVYELLRGQVLEEVEEHDALLELGK